MKIIILLSLSVLISGCSTFGSNDFACSAPKGATCMSTRDIYAATNSGQVPSHNVNLEESDSSTRDAKSIENNSENSPATRVTDPVIDTFVAPRLPDSPVPVRTPAIVMRIKVYSYEDSKTGVLYTPGYIFSEIEPRRWTIGKQEASSSQNGRLLKPLSADPQSKTTHTKPKNSQ